MRRSTTTTVLLALLGLGLLLAGEGCHASGSWTFAVSRHAYGGGSGWDLSLDDCDTDGTAALVILGLCLLPVAIDLVLLPICAVRDVCVR